MRYEFKVVPAPRRGEKARGLRTTEDRFALALGNVINVMAAEGWDYVRAETLPVEERSGLMGTKTSYHNMLVFRRELSGADAAAPVQLTTVELAPRLRAAGDAPVGAAPSLGPATGIAAE